MRDAETVLGIIRERGRKRLPLEDAYRQLYNPELYLRAYGRLYKNDGAMTGGITDETVDEMSLEKVEAIIDDIRHERYRWTPVRQVEIPKKKGSKRPLGIPTWSDKLLQEVMRSLLEAYYEPQFSHYSHGFRPAMGCHTALTEIHNAWKGTKWFIEGDIKGCFDNIGHAILVSILKENIHDNRFLRLVENLLKAGYCEQWKYNATLSGTPQGGVISPILANIYLNELDTYIREIILPEYTRGTKRKAYYPYQSLKDRIRRHKDKGEFEEVKELRKELRLLPSGDPDDPDFRRVKYVRYADDFLLSFIGSKVEAEEIRSRIKDFLADRLKLELSEEKTLITHAVTGRAKFLGYEIAGTHCDTKINKTRAINGVVSLIMPETFVEERSKLYMQDGKPIHRSELMNDDDFSIIQQYQAELRGYYEYYALAYNVHQLTRLKRVMEVSLLKTLASKHKTSVVQVAAKYKKTVKTDSGLRKSIECRVERPGHEPLTARFGGIALRRNVIAVIRDKSTTQYVPRTELVKRLLAGECEACGNTDRTQVHHIRKLADLKVDGRREKPQWMQMMSARKRKTLVLCHNCHVALHTGKPLGRRATE